MKKTLLIISMALLTAMSAWADVEINETNFPDENFRNWVLSQEYGADGVLTDEEIAGIITIEVSNLGIKSLKGIEYFTALTELHCIYNQLTSLDVSGCTALTRLYCYLNQLTSLDVSKNNALEYLYCYGNPLNTLDVSKNTALKELDCVNNQLTSLDVSKNTALTKLDCRINQITELDLSKNTALTMLNCYQNQLTKLNVSGCTALESITCYGNQLTELDVSGLTALIGLSCSMNQITSLNVSGCAALTELSCDKNHIKGKAMDALVQSLPTLKNKKCRIKVINNYDNSVYYYGRDNMIDFIDIWEEHNVLTKAQVAILQDKYWTAYYGYYRFGGLSWGIYEGSDPEPVIIAEETTVNPSETAESGQATTTESGVTTSLGDEDVVDAAEGSVTIVSSMTNDAVKELIETTQPGSSYFNETFKGFYFLLAAGKGKVEFDIETSGGYSLGVMKGSELVGVYTQSTKGTVTIPYDLEEDTWFFAYPVVNTPAAANRAAVDGALKVYGLRIIPEESGTPDGINNLAPAFAKGNGVVYNLQGQRTDGLQKGLNIVDGKKVWVK